MKNRYFFTAQKPVSIYRAGHTSITQAAGGFPAVHNTDGKTFIHISSESAPDLARTQGK